MVLRAKKIALLLAGMSFSAVSIAAPVTVAEIDAARSAGSLQQAWITGASAPTLSVYRGWVKGCDVDTNTVFTSDTSTTLSAPGSFGSNPMAYACKRSNRVSVLYHTLDGGSLNAYTPHTVGAVLHRVKFVGTGNGCTTSLNYVDKVNALNNATVFKSCTKIGGDLPTSGSITAMSTSNQAALATDPNAPSYPVGGFSDVEAALFATSIGGGNVSALGVESDVGVGQAFGVAVSIPLYRAMQVAQGIVETGTTVNDFDPAKAPNINSTQYASIIAQGGENKLSILLPSNLSRLNIARRVDTSGTQSSSNAFFLRNPCSGGLAATLSPTTASNDIAGQYAVTLNSSTGNVKTRLNTASNATVENDKYAIGVMSMENDWRDGTATAAYRFVKIDGVHPEAGDVVNARKTATTGEYKFHMELKSFVRSDSITGKAAKTQFEAAIIGQITNELKNPEAASCAVYPRGLTLNPANFSSCTAGAEVAKMTNGGKNCAAPVQFLQ